MEAFWGAVRVGSTSCNILRAYTARLTHTVMDNTIQEETVQENTMEENTMEVDTMEEEIWVEGLCF